VLVRSADMNSMEMPESLLAIARAGPGFNNIPIGPCAQQGIVVMNTPGANANAVKELVVAGMLLAARDIIGGIEWCKSIKGKDAEVPKLVEKGKNKFVGPEIKGKVLGVIGLGAIGALVANAGQGMNMKVIGFDPFITVDHAWMLSRSVARSNSLDELVAQSDYISVHVPLMDKTRGMVDSALISRMKPGAVVLNFSRAELVKTPDMLAALAAGAVRAYVTDFPTDELIGEKGVIAIPHLGASTPESEDNCAQMASEQIAAYLTTGTILNSVNYPDCELGIAEHCRVAVLHANVPNTVGQITSLVAGHGVNIAGMVNRSKGQYAYTVLDLDDAADDKLLEGISKLESIYRVRKVK